MLTATRLNLALLLARVPLGLYFAIAGYNKIVGGVAGFVDAGMKKAPAGVPAEFVRAYLNALPFAELAVGLFVLIGLVVRLNALLMSLMLISFLIADQQAPNIAKLTGGAGSPLDKNWVFLGVALCLALLGSGEWVPHRAFRRRKRVVVTTTGPVTTARGTPIV